MSIEDKQTPKRSSFKSAARHQAVQQPPAPAEQKKSVPPSPLSLRQPPLLQPVQIAGSHRLSTPLLISLVLLIIFLAAAGVVELHPFDGVPGLFTRAAHTTGSTAQPPLNAKEVNQLRHIAAYLKYKQLASLYVSRMSLDVELGQLFMAGYADTSYSPDLDMMVNHLHAGGVIMYEFQMNTFNQTRHDIAEMQKHATFPLLISTDEEGGPYVHRLSHIYGPRMSAADIATSGDPNVAAQQGHQAAHDLLALGINANLAPDVDVNLASSSELATRTFGSTPGTVITFAGRYMQALQADGVVACIKHFPGLGAAVSDPHTGLPVVNRTRAQLYAVELAPFKAFIQAQNRLDKPGMIMPTDVLMPAIDPKYPAELSHIFMTDILRKEFGYDGVVLTDALYMQGISQNWSMPEAALLALNAGNDMLIGPSGADQMIAMLDGLKAALSNGSLSKARIIALKISYHLMPAVPPAV